MKVHALPADDRPREKLSRYGVAVLSDAELLALLLGSGTKGKNVVELSRELLQTFGGLVGICQSSLSRAKEISGIGKSRLATLAAIGEIVKRAHYEASKSSPSLADTIESFRKKHYEKEEAYLLFLDGRVHVSGTALVSRGKQDHIYVESNEILRLALSEGSSRFALLHVHPSGIPLPSKADMQLTKETLHRAEELHLSFYDHFIIGSGGVYSFREHGHMETDK